MGHLAFPQQSPSFLGVDILYRAPNISAATRHTLFCTVLVCGAHGVLATHRNTIYPPNMISLWFSSAEHLSSTAPRNTIILLCVPVCSALERPSLILFLSVVHQSSCSTLEQFFYLYRVFHLGSTLRYPSLVSLLGMSFLSEAFIVFVATRNTTLLSSASVTSLF